MRTIRGRLACWLTILMALLLLAFSLFSRALLHKTLLQTLDRSLHTTALLTGFSHDTGKESPEDIPPQEPISREEEKLLKLQETQFDTYLSDLQINLKDFTEEGQLWDEYGKDLGHPRNPDDVATVLKRQEPIFRTLTQDGKDYRFCTWPVFLDVHFVGVVQVSRPLSEVEGPVSDFWFSLLTLGPLFILGAAGGGFWLARGAFRPIRDVTKTADSIQAHDLSARIAEPGVNDEVGRLVGTLNRLLSRLENAFEQQRRFTDDAAHELRTPLTAMKAIIGSTLERVRGVDEYQTAMMDLAEEVERLRRLTEDLLLLARDGDTAASLPDKVDMSNLLIDVVDSMQPLAQERGLKMTSRVAPDVSLQGDQELLIRLLVNILNNAIKYTDKGTVEVKGTANQDSFRICITDTGRGIPQKQLPHIFDRFYRADDSRSGEGSGIGLAIAQTIVERHSGQIEAHSVEDQGTDIVITLPL